ncbi:hypothetical protein [Kitasatospora sp. P5_F3]
MEWLVNASAEATFHRLRRQEQEIRQANEAAPLLESLGAALKDVGLDPVSSKRSGVTVAVPPDASTLTSSSELTVALHRGWELAVNSAGSLVVSVRAPITEHGAQEVAGMIRDILAGRHRSPFRR